MRVRINRKNEYKEINSKPILIVLDICSIALGILITKQILGICNNVSKNNMFELITLIGYIVFNIFFLWGFQTYKVYFKFDKSDIISKIFTACIVTILPVYVLDKTFKIFTPIKPPVFYVLNAAITIILVIGIRYLYLEFENKYVYYRRQNDL